MSWHYMRYGQVRAATEMGSKVRRDFHESSQLFMRPGTPDPQFATSTLAKLGEHKRSDWSRALCGGVGK